MTPVIVPLYASLGFVDQGVFNLPGGGPRLWPMWREPRAPDLDDLA